VVAVIDVKFTPLPAHVRTARLIAIAMARRVGVPEDLLDEVRLAVGEACSRAVGVNATRAPAEPVSMKLSDDLNRFIVEVQDAGAVPEDSDGSASGSIDIGAITATGSGEGAMDALPPEFGLVVIGGLVEDVEITSGNEGTCVRMGWPAKRPDGASPAS
jgi:anti-sigma regulatory factor (Ser/Thr protein kinase)